ncbi:hypothetical protein [Capnocytophaga cynodegmi]|jgi:hypothetical protein|uniref:DUF4365 domain-containing protein n=3 Tax=Bacteroidota TaxID=976 RepID=A0A0B7HHI3_9FLAO|nr:hypothetical protein [Capnocytophaga cynodegmi]CEN38124.1 conserved hypothetical protein [Capnocytophaga cynodegmi]
MRDNKPLEEQAELTVRHHLIKHGFSIAKPSYDTQGGDILIIEKPNEQFSKILKVQSKGRTLGKNGTNVRIPISYVTDDFILFIYLVKEDNSDFLYVLFAKDIKQWTSNGKEYTLSITENSIEKEYMAKNLLSEDKISQIRELLKKAQIKKYTSIIIDGIFLGKAVNNTRAIYNNIWTDKRLTKPHIQDVVQNILEYYNRYDSENNIINCYILESNHFPLSEVIEMDMEKSILKSENHIIKVYKENLDDVISFEALDKIERLINNENIILVADDKFYELPLNELKSKGVDIICVTFNESETRNMFVQFRWGDIAYPLGRAMGLEKYEL